ncbi:SDR family oxidoreductase [Corynebacterium auriscanis]|uniref:SDR family oxidoreductase n=1 Tax=Corynebacterium auriscanis TaxID=99807 RepID=UPI00224514C8|nr:sugar nucleotide-binding protein [Corynebacterium auriscanis]MCX2162241.1 NAD(P)-dependent oxidoreductase [Corynebacterium auriscanis]
MSFIVVGCNGRVGSFLTELFGPAAIPVDRMQLDLSSKKSVEQFFSSFSPFSPNRLGGATSGSTEGAPQPFPLLSTPSSRPTALINCAAFTAVDAAESDTGATVNHHVNAVAPGWLAQHCQQLQIPMVHISTDYVFDGQLPVGQEYSTTHPVQPVNAYGRAKAEGERAVIDFGGHVVRTAWVYSGPEHPNKDFASTMLRLARHGVNPNVVNDQFGRPSHAQLVASAIKEVAEALADGAALPQVLHATGSGEPTSWCEFAREVFAAAGYDPQRVSAISTSEYPTPARRPANSVLSLAEWETCGLSPLPAWRETLREKAAVW